MRIFLNNVPSNLYKYQLKEDDMIESGKSVPDSINYLDSYTETLGSKLLALENTLGNLSLNPDIIRNLATKDYVDQMAEKNITTKKNDAILVAEMINVAKSYYNVRLKEDGNPRFMYNTTYTPVSDLYNVEDPTYGGAIDCSTYIGLILRGIPVWKSPYKSLIQDFMIENDLELEGSDEDVIDPGDNDGDNSVLSSSSIKANKDDYDWALDPFEWSNPITVNGTDICPVRRASQLAQWMYERGYSIPLDETLSNIEPGDIIFWAKKNTDGTWRQPNRYMNISHVAICINKKEPPVDDPKFPSKYPYKHTMLEVTTIEPYILNRTLEKCSPESVVMVCRPDLGSLNSEHGAININTNLGITNLNNMFIPGTYYLTSKVTDGVPDDMATGMYQMLQVDRALTRTGKTYSLKQTLTNAKYNDCIYVRTQYCYSHLPNASSWTDWKKYVPVDNISHIARNEFNTLLNRVSAIESEISQGSVTNEILCTSITLDTAAITFFSLDSTRTLTPTLLPEDPSLTSSACSWYSDNTSVATVENGVVTPKGEGSCTITVVCGGISATCHVGVSL